MKLVTWLALVSFNNQVTIQKLLNNQPEQVNLVETHQVDILILM